MYNVSVEQIIKVKEPKVAAMYKIAAIAACILAATTIPATNVFGLGLLIVFIVVAVLLFKYYDAEYEYVMLDKELTVERIMSRSTRKKCGEYNVSRATLITYPGTQDALRMEHMKLKTEDYTANNGENGVIVMYTYNSENELVRIFLQPDERVLEAIRESAPKTSYKVTESVVSSEK